AQILKVTTAEGFELRATAWHKMYVIREGDLIKIPLAELQARDKILVQSRRGAFGPHHDPDLAYLAGGIIADGTFGRTPRGTDPVKVLLYGEEPVPTTSHERA